jgi:hypothetical protein
MYTVTLTEDTVSDDTNIKHIHNFFLENYTIYIAVYLGIKKECQIKLHPLCLNSHLKGDNS